MQHPIPGFTHRPSGALWIPIRSAALAILCLCLMGPTVQPASQETLPAGADLLDKYVEVTGGKAAYGKIENRVTKGTFEIMNQGIKASLTIWAARPNKVYSLFESEALGTIEKGTDGEVVWEMAVMSGPSIKEGQERTDYLREVTFDKFVAWREIYKGAECIGVETIEEKPCYKVIITPNDGKPQTFYYDVKSNLAVKADMTIETAMGTIPFQMYFRDYKEVDGILMAHRVRVLLMGQERLVVTESVEHNVEMPPDRFKLPDDIQALLEKQEKKEQEEEAGKSEGGKEM